MGSKQGSSAFLTMFVPGLVIGLVVGGLAGAFLAPVLESGNLKSVTQDASKPIQLPNQPAGTSVDRDARPISPDVAVPGDSTSPTPEVQPEDKQDDTPANDRPKTDQLPGTQPG